MKKSYLLFAAITTSLYLLSCEHDAVFGLDKQLAETLDKTALGDSHEWYILPSGEHLSEIPNQDPNNPITDAKVALGKMLFFETGIGLQPKNSISKETYSCSSCHIPERSYTAGRFQGVADGALGFGTTGELRFKNPHYTGDQVDAQGARPLPSLNLAYVRNALWAGTFGAHAENVGTESAWHQDTLVEINFKGFEGLESNNMRALVVHRQVMNKAVADSLGYTEMFDAAFPEYPESQRYSLQTTAFAIAAYFRTILTNQAPFQLWLKGDESAMTEEQKRGALLFFGKAGCVNCHNSPSLNNTKFFALGVNNLYQSGYEVFATGPNDKRNLGRGGFTGRAEDMHKFKVPQLYNLKDVGFYFHGSSKRSLREVVEYFNAGIPENPLVPKAQISGAFHPLNLSAKEVDQLVDFLENGLYDPNILRYKPETTMSGNCFPNNDAQSRADMRCQ